jgi:hypothetical protein
MNQIHAGAHLEQFAAEMLRRADADRAETQPVRRAPRQLDELLDRPHRQARRNDHDERDVGDQIDCGEIGDRVVDRIARQMRAHGERGRRDQHDMAVRRRLRHIGIRDVAPAARLVLDHRGLVETRLQTGRDFPRHHVVGTAGGERHDDAQRLVGKAGRPRRLLRAGAVRPTNRTGNRRYGRRAGEQRHELAAFHSITSLAAARSIRAT